MAAPRYAEEPAASGSAGARSARQPIVRSIPPPEGISEKSGTNNNPARVTTNSEDWISSVHLACANEPSGFDPKTFVGWLRPFSLYGLEALDVACNIPRIDHGRRHARIDGLEDYIVVFQITGKSAIDHGDTLLNLELGDLVLVDPTRPMAIFREPGVARHVALHLPRQQLVAHLGYEPKGDLHRRGTAANRLLLQLITEALEEREPAPAIP
jgi:AraC family transcriptional activator of tynA and feaB